MLDSGSDWHEVGLTGFLLDLGGGEGGGAIRPEGRQPIGGRRGDSLFFSSYGSFYLFIYYFFSLLYRLLLLRWSPFFLSCK